MLNITKNTEKNSASGNLVWVHINLLSAGSSLLVLIWMCVGLCLIF